MKVAILDTGADINHKSIKDNIVDYYNGLSYPANFPESVSVCPGVDIVGARANTDRYDKVLTGTSQSCAHITGLIASRY